MALPPEVTIVEALTFDQLSQVIKAQIEDEVHRRQVSPSALWIYINSKLASTARETKNGTALIAWAQAQGILEVKFRLDEHDQFLRPPQCAFWLRWD